MAAKLQPYPKYNPVLYDYIESLPDGWKLLPNIAIFEERIERGHDNEELLSVTIKRGVIKQTEVEIKKDNSNEDKSKYKLVKVKDIAYNKMRMWQGALGYSSYQGIVSPAYVILKPKVEINPRYFHYMFRTGFYTNYSKRFSYGIVDDQLSLRYTDFKRMYSIVPPLSIQNAIVDYLDEKCEEIDRFIQNKERLIELLEEQRYVQTKKLIKGKFFGNSQFIDSTIEAIGKIPYNWKIKNLSSISKVVLGKMLCNEDKGGYVKRPYLKSKNIGWKNVIVSEVDTMWFSKIELQTYRVKEFDLLVSEGGEVGKTAIWRNELDECYIQNSVHKITFNKDCNPKYYLNFFYVLGGAEYFKSIVNQVSIAHLTREKLIKVKCPVPPYEEQCEIVSKIEKLNAEIDLIIQKSQKEIEAIKEFKEAIITEIITGKLSPFTTN